MFNGRMIMLRKGLFVLTTAVVLGAAVPAGVAHAADAGPVGTPSVALRSLLAQYPGSTVFSSDTIRIAPGVLLTLPADHPANLPVVSPGSRAASTVAASTASRGSTPAYSGVNPAKPAEPSGPAAPGTGVVTPDAYYHNCAYYYLCLFSESDFTGYKLSLYYCGFVDLGRINFPGGGKWNDKTSSIVNHQTPNTASGFYNWDGVSQWVYVTGLWSYGSFGEYDDGVGIMRSLGPDNDIIDGVHVC
jgi:hypothetical protein